MKSIFSILLIFSINPFSFCQKNKGNDAVESFIEQEKHKAIRLAPAPYWNTFGFEYEQSFKQNVTIGFNFTFTYGRDIDNDAFNQAADANSAILNEGYIFNIIAKRYFNNTFNKTFLFSGIEYNSIEYFDIDKRPYTIINSLSFEKRTEILETYTRVANLVGVNFGIGYQNMMVPNHLIVNFQGGIATYLTVTNKPIVSFFVTPSIGYKF